ncbi:MAG: DsbA family protein [Acetobacteraceae bacterium]|nr:DsbA family protein [Pseudomonadota bacterium]
MVQEIDFWFTMGSTYTYLSVGRLREAARAAGVLVNWRPIRNVGSLTGATQPPFLDGTAKMRYMWRDIERRALAYGLPINPPIPYLGGDRFKANRIALLGMSEGWGPAYVEAAYRQWFENRIPNGDPENIRVALLQAGLHQADVERVISVADGDELHKGLDQSTETARETGVFGSPSFVVGSEIFWGDDHLEDAISWAVAGQLRPR